MNSRSTTNASAKQLQTELDLPQSGSEDEDETWLTEFTGPKTTTSTEAVSESATPADMHLNSVEAFHSHPKVQTVADPDLPRTHEPIVMPRSAAQCSINGSECDLPGPLSRDDDEDSSPIVQDLDSADHVPCSTRDMTTSGHDYPTLTQSGFLMATPVVGTDSKEWVTTGSTTNTTQNQLNAPAHSGHLTGNNRKVTPTSLVSPPQNAKLTLGSISISWWSVFPPTYIPKRIVIKS